MRITAFFFSSVFTLFLITSCCAQSTQATAESKYFYQSGHRKLYNSDFNGAEDDLSKAIELNPGNEILETVDTLKFRNEIAYALRALARIQLKEYESSISDCNEALKCVEIKH